MRLTPGENKRGQVEAEDGEGEEKGGGREKRKALEAFLRRKARKVFSCPGETLGDEASALFLLC